MARISDQPIELNGQYVFYRSPIPYDGCSRLSNGIQVASVQSMAELQAVTEQIMQYCEIGDDLIAFLSQ